MEIVWLAEALEDRKRIFYYIAEDSWNAAEKLDLSLEVLADQLASFPRSGRTGRLPGTRELILPYSDYFLVYREDTEQSRILIARVLHGAQLWPAKHVTRSRKKSG